MSRIVLRVKELMAEKSKRDGSKLTANHVASEINVSPHTIRSMMANERDFSRRILADLCDYFDCELSDILLLEKDEAGEDETSPEKEAA